MRLRFLVRGLLRAPAFSLASIGTIALAVCLSTTVFAVVDGVLFRPLPYPEADRLFTVSGLPLERNSGAFSSADVRHLRAAVPGTTITALGEGWLLSDPIDPAVTLRGLRIDAAFFDVLGRRPLAGGFEAADFAAAAGAQEIRPAIVSFEFWQRHLGGDINALGTTVDVPQQRIRVAGVLPSDFVFPHVDHSRIDLLFAMPDEWRDAPDRWSRSWDAVARLGAGQGPMEVRARFDAALASTLHEYGPARRPQQKPYDRVALEPLADVLGSKERPFFGLAFAGAGLLVLIACINVTGLLLARTRARTRELRVRVALGAARREIALLVTSEAILVTVVGAAAGIALVYPALDLAQRELPEGVNLLKPLAIDWRVALFALASPLAAMLAFSALPVRRAFRDTPVAGVTSGTTPTSRSWAASTLLAAESGLGIALLVVGTFVLTSFATIRAEPTGLRTEGLGLLDVLVQAPQDTDLQRAEIQDRVVARVAAVPGVEGAALFGGILFEPYYGALRLDAPPHAPDAWVVDIPVSGGFFEIAGLSVEEGRLPSRDEFDRGVPVTVLSRRAARDLWGDEPALGRTVTGSGNAYTVVGIVADVRTTSQTDMRVGEAFTPAVGSRRYYHDYLFRTSGDINRVVDDVRAAVARDVPGVLVRRAEPIDVSVARAVRLQRFQASLFGIAGGAAALLLAVGVAGIVATSVRRRWREAGIRSALGASGGRLVRMLVADHLRPAAAGIAIGLVGSWWMKDVLRRFLYQLEPGDLRLWALASAIILVVVAVAAWLPARRAARADPAVVLRAE